MTELSRRLPDEGVEWEPYVLPSVLFLVIALQTIFIINMLRTAESSLLSKVARFARTIQHKHQFIKGKCEFCDISKENCKHEKLNITQTYTRDVVTQICECGKLFSFECMHINKFSRYDDEDEDEIWYCNDCGKVLND